MSDFRTECGRCGKRIRVMAETKKRRCFDCDRDDLLVQMRRRDQRAARALLESETP